VAVSLKVTRLGEFSHIGFFFSSSIFEKKHYRSSQNILAFFHGGSCALMLTKNGLVYFTGGFFSKTHLVSLVSLRALFHTHSRQTGNKKYNL
jgi:hypothetical protein